MFEYQTAIDSHYMYDNEVSATTLVGWLEQNVGPRGQDWDLFSPKFNGKTKEEKIARIKYGDVYVFKFSKGKHQLMFEIVWSHAIKIATNERIDIVRA